MKVSQTVRIAMLVTILVVSAGVACAVWVAIAPDVWPSLLQQSKPVKLRPIKDEEEISARLPLSDVLKSYADRHVPYYQDAFDDVVRSRVRHRQFQALETFAREIRRTKVTIMGGKWQLEEFYQVVGEPAAGTAFAPPRSAVSSVEFVRPRA